MTMDVLVEVFCADISLFGQFNPINTTNCSSALLAGTWFQVIGMVVRG